MRMMVRKRVPKETPYSNSELQGIQLVVLLECDGAECCLVSMPLCCFYVGMSSIYRNPFELCRLHVPYISNCFHS